MVKLNVRLPKSVDRAAEFAAVQQETTKQRIVETALRAYLRIGGAAA